MKTEKFSVEGLDVEIDVPENLKTKRLKLGGLLEFPCSCGFETLKIENEDVANASGARGNARNLWPLLKDAAEITKEWNKIHREAKSFVDYFEKLYAFKGGDTRWTQIRQGGFSTSFRISCPTCRRSYTFDVKVSNPEQPEPELTPLGAFRRFRLKRRKTERVLARWITENEHREAFPWKTPAKYIDYVLSLEPSTRYVQGLIDRLKETIKENPPKAKYAANWIEDLTTSLDEVAKDFERTAKKRLERELTHIEDLIPKPKEYRLAMIPTSAESLPPLSTQDLYG